tara:strand:+ start:2642 stop:3514 length:873 start_codon:yes stop_codon:yes gene_type:complete
MSRIKGIIDAVSDLAMDYSSRMARAKEQGFDTDTPYYHGTPAEDIEAFDISPEQRRFPKSFGVHMANTRNEATHYKPPTSGSVQELYAAPQNTLEIDIPRGGHFVSASMKADLDRGDIVRQLVDAKRDGNPYDSVRVRKDMPPDWTDWSGKEGYNENLIMLDPTRVRSVDAAFDPAKKGSSNLLASAAGVGLLGALGSEDADASPSKGLFDSMGDTALESMSGVNRAVADGVNFLTSDQINAILNLSGSDKRIPDLYDIPGIEGGTQGNYMEPGLLRQIVRQGSEFLSPI